MQQQIMIRIKTLDKAERLIQCALLNPDETRYMYTSNLGDIISDLISQLSASNRISIVEFLNNSGAGWEF